MWLLVWSGNPLLPIQFLATYGWSWHHVPEILSSFFLGMWVGSFRFLSCDGFNKRDALPLLILITLSALTPTYFWTFWLILVIVTIPSFLGYFAIRVFRIRKLRNEAYTLIGIEK
jgi:hypothetical protein